MLSLEAEEVIRLASEMDRPILMVRGVVNILGQNLGGVDRARQDVYEREVRDLANKGYLEASGQSSYRLTRSGYELGRYLAEETAEENKAPDTCTTAIGETTCTITYTGVSSPERELHVEGHVYEGFGGAFQVTHGSAVKHLCVLFDVDPRIFMCCFKGRAVSPPEGNMLLKRPGLRLVKLHLSGPGAADAQGVISFTDLPVEKQVYLSADSVSEELVDKLDDPAPEVLADCEKDVLQALLDDRKQRKSGGTTAIELASRPSKRRFYSIRTHIRATLEDLEEKGLARTDDQVHYRLVVDRLADAQRVISGTPSDDLFLAQAVEKADPAMASDPKNVFVVHGRDEGIRKAMFELLQALGLNPIEWSQAIALTGKPSPYVGEVLDAAFGEAQAVVVLITGDDEARLLEKHRRPNDPLEETQLTPQPRPNVLFEAGMAFGRHPDRTLLVQIGKTRPFSDIGGRHVLRFDGSERSRNELANRLRTAKCAVDTTGNDWLKAGDFDETLRQSQ